MSNIRDNAANVAGEIELTDEQLEAVCGAWDGGDDIEFDFDDDDGSHHHFNFFKKEKEVFFKKEKISKASGGF